MKIVLTALLCCPAVCMADAYRCTVNGATVYQAQPCDGGVKLKVPAAPDPDSREAKVAEAIALHDVIVGMTADEVLRSWSKPTRINKYASSGGPMREQWVYETGRWGNAQYLFFEGGVLRSFQSPEFDASRTR